MVLIQALLAILAAAAQEPDPTIEKTRAAILRSLPAIEKEGTAWIHAHDCLSCHHVPFLLWSHQEARAKGIEVDPKKVAEWVDWSRAESVKQRVKLRLSAKSLEELKDDGLPPAVLAKLTSNASRFVGKEEDFAKQLPKYLSTEEAAAHYDAVMKRATRESGDGGGLDTMAQLLLAGTYASDGDGDFSASLRTRILGMQNKDGSWAAGGQIGRMNRSTAESTETTTLWTLFALSEAADEAAKPGIDRARAFMKGIKPGRLLEGTAVRLLLEKSDAAMKELTGRQNADGGWASIRGGTSDALATGQALYALGRAGLAGSSASIARARAFLIETQTGDGSWTVAPLCLTSSDTKPARLKNLEPIYRFWGSAWAVIGLARSLPSKP